MLRRLGLDMCSAVDSHVREGRDLRLMRSFEVFLGMRFSRGAAV